MRKLLSLAIPIVFGVGVITAVINDPDPSGSQLASGRVTETTLPAVIEDPAPAVTETTVTTLAPAPVDVTPTTIAAPPPAPVTTTTVRRVVAPSAPVSRPPARPATPTTQAPAPTPTPAAIDCGTGTASARSYFEQTPGGYQLGAKVINDSTKTIELDSLIVRASYPDGTSKTFVVNVNGKRVDARPGAAEMAFPIPDSAGPTPPTSFEISEFRFHTAGLPECASQ